jgi:Na+/melibiose symporter-like transporter
VLSKSGLRSRAASYDQPVEPITRAFRGVLANRDLRRVELAFACFNAVEYGVWIALLVFAFQRGGATEASLVAVIQLVPAALVAPPASVLADRRRPVRVLAGAYLVQAIGLTASALAMAAGAPFVVVVALVTVTGCTMILPRPTQAALLPFLARSVDELTAANVVSSWVENGSVLVGTALTGVLLDAAGVTSVFAAAAGLILVAALLVAPVHGPAPAPRAAQTGVRDDLTAGARVLVRQPQLRLLVGLLFLGVTIFGALDLLCVVLAIDVLGRGGGWAGYLNAAFAAGGVAGSLVAALLVGRRRLGPAVLAGMLVWGLSFVAIALWPSALVALVVLAAGGVGRTLLVVASHTLLQRTTPTEVLARVFGLLEGLDMVAMALGALIVPPLVALGGSRGALAGVGLLLALGALLAALPLRAVDRAATVPVVEIALLRSISVFAPLPAPAIEGVARALEPVHLAGGSVVIELGEPGDRYYAIATGEVDVSRNGTHVATLGRGDGFGEIALLEDVPRTATVTARSHVDLFALERDPFLTAVTGHAPAAQAASQLVERRRLELELLSPTPDRT